jgi:phage shock protein PspC (stress-responsive transcriptional regulator)
MRKVTLASLSGNAYQLEEAAHQQISSYLERAARTLATNPDRAEILADLEQAIADKCDSFLGKHKNVISAEEAGQILHEMGPVQGTAGAEAGASGAGSRHAAGGEPDSADDTARFAHDPEGMQMAGNTTPRKRLMRLPSEGMMGGVCAGIAAYFDIDVVWVRLAFVLITIFTWSAWILVWLAALIVMPAARTPEQMASARGAALSAREVMERATRKSAEIARAATDAARDAERNLRDTFGRR